MNAQHISSRANPWVQQHLRWQQQPRLRKQAAQAWLEGEHLVGEALARAALGSAQFEPLELVFPANAQGQAVATQLLASHPSLAHLPVVFLAMPLYKLLVTLESLPSCCAVIGLKQSNANTLPIAAPAVVLDQVQDPGNVGTIIRLCAAFGVGAVYASAGCASAWGSKALRAGQGAQLAVNIVEDVDLNTLYPALKASNIAIAATTLSAQSAPLTQLRLPQQAVWVFGHEGQGISASTRNAATHHVHIPMQGGFESLNVATAAAITLWHWQQQG